MRTLLDEIIGEAALEIEYPKDYPFDCNAPWIVDDYAYAQDEVLCEQKLQIAKIAAQLWTGHRLSELNEVFIRGYASGPAKVPKSRLRYHANQRRDEVMNELRNQLRHNYGLPFAEFDRIFKNGDPVIYSGRADPAYRKVEICIVG